MATQYFKRNLLLNLYREGKKKSLVCFHLMFEREKYVWHLQPVSSVWRPLAFLPVTLSIPHNHVLDFCTFSIKHLHLYLFYHARFLINWILFPLYFLHEISFRWMSFTQVILVDELLYLLSSQSELLLGHSYSEHSPLLIFPTVNKSVFKHKLFFHAQGHILQSIQLLCNLFDLCIWKQIQQNLFCSLSCGGQSNRLLIIQTWRFSEKWNVLKRWCRA